MKNIIFILLSFLSLNLYSQDTQTTTSLSTGNIVYGERVFETDTVLCIFLVSEKLDLTRLTNTDLSKITVPQPKTILGYELQNVLYAKDMWGKESKIYSTVIDQLDINKKSLIQKYIVWKTYVPTF